MSKHTKGTWKAKQTQDKLIEISTDDYFICFLSWADEKHEEEQKANAQLIAAAPDLLEELEEGNEAVWRAISIIEEIEEKYEIFDTDYNELDGLKAHLKGTSIGFKEAIAKAKGDTDEMP